MRLLRQLDNCVQTKPFKLGSFHYIILLKNPCIHMGIDNISALKVWAEVHHTSLRGSGRRHIEAPINIHVLKLLLTDL